MNLPTSLLASAGFLTLFLLFSIFIISLRNLNETLLTLLANIQGEYVDDMPSSYEIERLAREAEFNRRIDEMKADISSTSAVEMHPDVRNLPHDSVRKLYADEGEEVAL